MVPGYAAEAHAAVAAVACAAVAAVAACVVAADYVAVVVYVAVIVGGCVIAMAAAYTAVVDYYEVVDLHAVVGDYCAAWQPGLVLRTVAEDAPADELLSRHRMRAYYYVAVIHDLLPDGSWPRWPADHDLQRHIERGSCWPGLDDWFA